VLPRARDAARAWRERLRAEALALATAPDLPAELRDAARALHDIHCAERGTISRAALRAAERRFVKTLARLVAVYDQLSTPPSARRPVWDPLVPRATAPSRPALRLIPPNDGGAA
jgi:hypothetical protein